MTALLPVTGNLNVSLPIHDPFATQPHLFHLRRRSWTLATSLKYCMAGNTPVEALSPHMETFLKMMHNEDLDVKKAALLMVNAAVHHQVQKGQ